MHEILRTLGRTSFVLDLGCAEGSFRSDATKAIVVRLDEAKHAHSPDPFFVQGDARELPFANGTFAAVIANHSLEHIEGIGRCLREIGRVLRSDGCLFVSVPDASTFTDRLYRWLARGGGHANAFTSSNELAELIERGTGLRLVAIRTLYSSLSFLNARNSPRPRPRRLMFLGGGSEWSLFLYVWLSRSVDRVFKLRSSIYGWALYFGSVPEPINTEGMMNVCIRCGSGSPAWALREMGLVQSSWIGARVYRCPSCGARNPVVG